MKPFLILLLLWSSASCLAQDFGAYREGDPTIQQLIEEGGIEKVRARLQYFYNRLTYPGGTIPVGARAKAWKYAQEKMSLYSGSPMHGTQATFEWKNVGPYNIGGRIVSVAVNPKNPNTIFIGAADGGVWRTYDEGKSWRSVSDEFPTQAMGAIAINPVDTNIIYAGTGEANFALNMFDGGGMMKSTDGGTTWFEIGQSLLPDYGRASDIVINPQNPDMVFVAIPDGVRDANRTGIYRSTDGGTTWNLVLPGMMTDIVIDSRNPNVLYTVSSPVSSGRTVPNPGMFKTTDSGENWLPIDIGVDNGTMGRTSIAISRSDPNILLIGVSELSGSGRTYLLGLFRTMDGGATWEKLTVPFDYMVSQGWFDNIVGIHPTNPDILYAGGVKLIRSGDGGKTWARIPDEGFGGILHVDQHAIEFNPVDPDRVYVGNDGGFYIGTSNGTNWVKSDLGMSITQFIGGAMHPSSDAFLLGGTQDNGTMLSTNAPSWQRVLYGDGGNSAINPLRPNILYGTQQNARFWRSEDFGNTWTQSMGNLPIEQSLFYIDYALDELNPNVLYYGTYRFYKSDDDGRTWFLARDCLFPTGTSCYYISAISVAPYDGSIVMAGATGGHLGISTNAGASWTIISSGLPQAYCSSVKSFSRNVFYATYSRYGVDKVWRSTDGGTTWTSLNGNLPDVPVNDVIELDGKLIIGTHLGAFISEDDGTTWQRFGTGLPSVAVFKLRYNKLTGTLRAITHGRGMFDMQWKTLNPSKPVFLSSPDTTLLESGQPFIYAPVVLASPSPQFSLIEGPSDATLDKAFGIVRWKANVKSVRFTLRAENSEGYADQVFTLNARDVPAADWEVISSETFSTSVNAMKRTLDGTFWVSRDSAWVSRSTDHGQTWQHMKLQGTLAAVLDIHAFDAQRAIVGTRGGQIIKTTDGGSTWRETYYGIASRFGNIHFWNENDGIAISEGQRDSVDVLLTSDGGETWHPTPTRAHARFPIDNSLYFVDRQNGWYGSSNQNASPPVDAAVMHTSDGGQTWAGVTSGTRNATRFAFFNQSQGYLIDPTQNRIRRTNNGGVSWSSVFAPMNGLRCVGIHADVASNSLWVTTDTSAWVSRNAGSSWMRTQLVPAGPQQAVVFLDSTNGWIMSRNGILQRYRLGTINSAPRIPIHPEAITLGYAYPNPALVNTEAVIIPFSLRHSMGVQLRIYNSVGVEVAAILNEPLPAGEHIAVWELSRAVNGTYFYTFTSGQVVKTGRMVIFR